MLCVHLAKLNISPANADAFIGFTYLTTYLFIRFKYFFDFANIFLNLIAYCVG